MALFVPHKPYTIQPYAAQKFPRLFGDPDCPVIAIAAERTFWEKATILHKQAHRENSMQPRLARHYYDMYRLANSRVKESSLSNLDLLAKVVAFKSRFYYSRYAQFQDAKPGTFKLIPNKNCLDELKRDYKQMEVMIFGDRPTFDEIITCLKGLEDEINSLQSDTEMFEEQI